jgi:hypothetical protein
MRVRPQLWATLSLGLCALAMGCGGSAATADGSALSAADGQFVDCSHETRATPYAAGTVVTSKNGVFDVTLVDNRPGTATAQNPPGDWVKGSNTWDLEVKDHAGGDDLTGLSIVTVPFMPDHNHGTSITPVTTDEGAGRYVVSPLYLYMGGYWEITLKLRPPATDGGAAAALVPDSALFKICIPD